MPEPLVCTMHDPLRRHVSGVYCPYQKETALGTLARKSMACSMPLLAMSSEPRRLGETIRNGKRSIGTAPLPVFPREGWRSRLPAPPIDKAKDMVLPRRWGLILDDDLLRCSLMSVAWDLSLR